jgi:thiosulfate/3-mercaptopyruvate sulfurtransferase
LDTALRQDLLTSCDDLAARLGERRLRIVDCRFDLMAPDAGRQAYLEGHIPGAVYADLDKDLSGPVTADSGRHPLPTIDGALATFSRLSIDADTGVVCYDAAGGAIASRAWWLLRWLGHRNVTVLDGGLPAWLGLGLPLEAGEQEVARRNFSGAEVSGRVLTTAEIIDGPDGAGGCRLLDARDAARFRGEAEPIDTRAGHIPGTRNLPFTACLQEDGRWLDAESLRQMLKPLLGDDESVTWSVMCGSGVTACHLAISGLLAGYSEPRVYVGSWSEWIRDPSRPIGPGTAM